MADPSSRSNDSLHLAAKRGKVKAVKRHLEQCLDLEALDEDGDTALHLACKARSHRIAKLLLKKGASVHTANRDDGRTALHLAACRGVRVTVALLLKRGADVHAVDRNGFTALHRAADSGHDSIIELLLKSGSDIEAEAKNGHTPLACAMSSIFPEVVDELIRRGANVRWVSTKGGRGRTLLHLAAEEGNQPAMQLLLDAKLDIDAVDIAGRTPLHYVLCQHSCPYTLKWLLDNGAGINYRCRSNGFRALHFAVKGGSTSPVDLLLQYGADVNVQDKEGRTPVGFAVELSHSDMYPAFAKQLVMMKALNLFISERNLTVLSDDDELKSCSASCEAEIGGMMKSRIGNSNVTVFDVFSKGENRLARYAANEIVEQVLADGSYEAEFPIYANVILKKFLQGRERRDLLRQSTECLSGVINEFYEVPQDCVEIINRWLTNDDLALQIG